MSAAETVQTLKKRHFRGLSIKLGIVFLAFLLLAAVAAASLFWMILQQRSDATVVNMAGRQRALSQRMAKEAMALASLLERQKHRASLRSAMDLFDRSLHNLQYGNQGLGIPPARDRAILAQLSTLHREWGAFRDRLLPALADSPPAEPPESLETIITQSDRVFAAADRLTALFGADSQRRVGLVIALEVAILILTLLTVVAGWLLIRAAVVSPIAAEVEERTKELRRRTRELEKANRHKSEFLQMISHELRTPLNSIIGFGELIRDGGEDPLSPQQEHFLNHVLEGAIRLLHLIDDILDLLSLEADSLPLRPEPIPVSEALPRCLAPLIRLAQEKEVDLRVEEVDRRLTVLADPVRFKQIIHNLGTNAVRFTPPGGSIRVNAHEESGTLIISVADTGIGIPSRDFEKVFSEFEQVDRSTTREAGGAGLGLPLTKKLVELHGGRIWLESEPGRGSAFYFSLPLGPTKTSHDTAAA